MNLVDGGVFDLSGTWGVPVPPDDPLGSHLLHSCGTDTDVGIRDTNGHPINEADLSNLIIHNYPGAFMIHEGGHMEHLHIHFADCQAATTTPTPPSATQITSAVDGLHVTVLILLQDTNVVLIIVYSLVVPAQ